MTSCTASFPLPALRAASTPSNASWAELVSHRSYLLRFAQRRLRDSALAEDAVHDVFEAVLSGRAGFAGRSALRSWLTGILKHKIVDAVRRDVRLESLDVGHDDGEPHALASGEPGPDEIAEHRQRLAHTLERLDALPTHLRDAVRLRLLDEQPTRAVCEALNISEENLFVRIHRARRQLAS